MNQTICGTACLAICGMTMAISLTQMSIVYGSDHADPIDSFNKERLEGGITDLFVFPVLKDDKPASPYDGNQTIPLHFNPADLARKPLSDADQNGMDALVIIICVRRALTGSGKLNLEPYTYRIRVDWNSPVTFAQADTAEDLMRAKGGGGTGYGNRMQNHPHEKPARPTPNEAFLRYGGYIQTPDRIKEDLTIEFRLNNEAGLQANSPVFLNTETQQPMSNWKEEVTVFTGTRDDPFIFPAFFGTNIVSMAVRIPMDLLPQRKIDLLVWATSHRGSRQVDHVGRSLRTQNPRFELLNTQHPSVHAKLTTQEHTNPSLMRDLANRFNLGSLFAYRNWDHVPDVLIYTTQYPVGFPNGRLLTDDVAALLAQHGDTLLYELSFQHNNGSWPRETQNDVNAGKFGDQFPFLLDPTKDDRPPTPLRLSNRNRMLLAAFAVIAVGLLILENWIVARIYHRIKSRRRYL